MTRTRRAIAAIILTVTTGALATVDAAHATAPSPAAPAPGSAVYVVQSGDYLSGIAVRMGVKLSALLAANQLTVASLIYPGMQLAVPEGGTVPAAPAAPAAPAVPVAAPAVYTVKNGDSLSALAGRMGVKLSALLAANQLTVASVIHPGRQLAVPAGGTLPAAPAAPATPGAPAPSAAAQQYVVRSGDYLTGIAPAMGVRVSALLATNKLTLTSVIYPGMRLTVPAGGVLPAAAPATPAAATPTPAATPATTSIPAPTIATPTNGTVASVLAFAQAQLGKPYKFNAAGPDSWDCSGLTMAAYAQIGIALPHYSGAQVNYGTAVDRATQAIMPGDLIFLESSVGSGVINHVGIAVNATQWIQAPRTGDVVRLGNIPTTRVVAIRRLAPAG